MLVFVSLSFVACKRIIPPKITKKHHPQNPTDQKPYAPPLHKKNKPIKKLFPASDWVGAQAAATHYAMRNFDEAASLFEDVLARDPHRVEVCCAVGAVCAVCAVRV